MMSWLQILRRLLTSLLVAVQVGAFIPTGGGSATTTAFRRSITTTTTVTLRAAPSGVAAGLVDSMLVAGGHSPFASLLVATIDSDVASIPENEFAPVFLGGVAVMLGGLVSALVVGYILERRDLYATVVADSYARRGGDDDEEFWKGLSEEERKKTKELLRRLKDSKEGGGEPDESSLSAGMTTEPSTPVEATKKAPEVLKKTKSETKTTETPKKQEVGMFSDYGD